MSLTSRWCNRLVILIVSVFLVVFMGCVAMQDRVTPCFIDPAATEYAKVEPTSLLPFTTLWDAKRVTLHMDYQHQIKQLGLMRDLQDDDMYVDLIRDAHLTNVKDAKELQRTMLDPAGPIGLLISGLGFGTMGALLIKRPGDKSEKQLLAELSPTVNNVS